MMHPVAILGLPVQTLIHPSFMDQLADGMLLTTMIRRSFNRFLLIIILIDWPSIALQHGIKIYQYAVNIPTSDEWEALADKGNPTSKSVAWIFTSQNEHRIVPTKNSQSDIVLYERLDLFPLR